MDNNNNNNNDYNNNDYYLFTVDYENDGEEFWGGAGGAGWNFGLWVANLFNLSKNGDSFALPYGQGYAFKSLLESCPGWKTGSANAPHPVCVESGLTFDEIQERLDYPASRN